MIEYKKQEIMMHFDTELQDTMFQETIMPPNFPWWRFTYNGKPRLAMIAGPQPSGCFCCLTTEGVRSMYPEKMFNIEDVTTLYGDEVTDYV